MEPQNEQESRIPPLNDEQIAMMQPKIEDAPIIIVGLVVFIATIIALPLIAYKMLTFYFAMY